MKVSVFRCGYRTREAEREREYEVSPLAIVARDNVLYLVCCLWNYGDEMQLALHRMTSAELLDSESSVPDGFDLDAYIARGEFDIVTGEMLRLEARFSRGAAYHLRETPVAADQTLPEQGGDLLLAATVPDTLQLRWWLLGFGADVEVLGPAALREEMAQTARAMSAQYDHNA
ncbi:MAG: WYL domain-containing protein [Pseudomonadota bacterium]|nr:WYL domain-containing protein [Pseudomonadota bacterium]